jgi:zinc-binding in reverse transcriptase
MSLSQLGQTGRTVILGNGKDTMFWQDRWIGECALMSHFHHLFQLCQLSNIFVYEVVRSRGLALSLSRTLTGVLLVELNALYNMVSTIYISAESDQMCWRLAPNGKFSTHKVYQWLMFRSITDISADLWWNLPIPLKIKVFMWLVMHNRILTRNNLRMRDWLGEVYSTMCEEHESVSHLFFTCCIAKQI